MDERNRSLNDAYRDYNDSLSFMLQSLSNIMRTHSDTQMAYNNNIRSLISILQSTSFNMERNNNAIIENIDQVIQGQLITEGQYQEIQNQYLIIITEQHYLEHVIH